MSLEERRRILILALGWNRCLDPSDSRGRPTAFAVCPAYPVRGMVRGHL